MVNDLNLLKLMEELGELSAQAAQFYTKPKAYPVDKLVEELGDVKAQIKIFEELNPELKTRIRIRKDAKFKRDIDRILKSH